MSYQSASLPTIRTLLASAVLALSGAAMLSPSAGAAAEPLGVVGAHNSAEVSVAVPSSARRYFLSLTVAPTKVDRKEGYLVAVYDSSADPASAEAKPLATFSFYPPPQVGKSVEFVAPLSADAIARRAGNGQLALLVTLLPVQEGAKLENSAVEIRSAHVKAE